MALNSLPARRRCAQFIFQLAYAPLLWALIACEEGPPQAPTDYESQASYLFEHMGDEGDEALRAGLTELRRWLEEDSARQSALLSGYHVSQLEASAVVGLTERVYTTNNLLGVSVLTKSPHRVESLIGVLTMEDFNQVIQLPLYERSFDKDPSCFPARSCLILEAESYQESRWGGVIPMSIKNKVRFRWVETESGWVALQQRWLLEPTTGPFLGTEIEMRESYYLGINWYDEGGETPPQAPGVRAAANGLASGGGETLRRLEETLRNPGALRFHVTWFETDYGAVSDVFPPEKAMNLLLDSLKADAQRLDEWIDGEGSAGELPAEEEQGDD